MNVRWGNEKNRPGKHIGNIAVEPRRDKVMIVGMPICSIKQRLLGEKCNHVLMNVIWTLYVTWSVLADMTGTKV